MSKLILPARCGLCMVGHVRILRDAAGAVEFAARSYVVDGAWTGWDPDGLWRKRHMAIRTFDAIAHSVALTEGVALKVGRAETNRLFGAWVGRETLGPWQSWSTQDCQLIIREGAPLLTQFADALTVGEGRLVWHRACARRSRFPRLAFMWRVLRDRLNARVAAWLASRGSR